MEWPQVWTIVGTNIGLVVVSVSITITMFLWSRSESNADRRHWHETAAADRRDLLTLIREIKEELKDFHGRLCAIEERNKR